MLSRLLKLTRWLSIPIFLSCVAMAVRTAFIWNNYDIFSFGRSPQWHCITWIGLFGTACEWHIYEPGHAPVFGSSTGLFYSHYVARGGIFSLSSDLPLYTTVTHDWYLFGWRTHSLSGVTKQSHYWVHLPFAPFIALLAAAAILSHWTLQALKLRHQNRQGLCPTCSYDLRAHHPGQRCPECGTPISIDSQPLRN